MKLPPLHRLSICPRAASVGGSLEDVINGGNCEICMEPLDRDSPDHPWRDEWGGFWLRSACTNDPSHVFHAGCLRHLVRAPEEAQVPPTPPSSAPQGNWIRWPTCPSCRSPLYDSVARLRYDGDPPWPQPAAPETPAAPTTPQSPATPQAPEVVSELPLAAPEDYTNPRVREAVEVWWAAWEYTGLQVSTALREEIRAYWNGQIEGGLNTRLKVNVAAAHVAETVLRHPANGLPGMVTRFQIDLMTNHIKQEVYASIQSNVRSGTEFAATVEWYYDQQPIVAAEMDGAVVWWLVRGGLAEVARNTAMQYAPSAVEIYNQLVAKRNRLDAAALV